MQNLSYTYYIGIIFIPTHGRVDVEGSIQWRGVCNNSFNTESVERKKITMKKSVAPTWLDLNLRRWHGL